MKRYDILRKRNYDNEDAKALSHMRIFAAIEIPPDIREEIYRTTAPIIGSADGISVIGRDNLHITIKFIGETDEDGLLKVKLAAQNVAARSSKTVKISGFGCFPSTDAPRIIWAGITQGGDFITAAAMELDRALPQKTRGTSGAFVPHVTVARVKNRSYFVKEQVARFISETVLSARQFKPSAISVVKSALTPSGPVYETVFSAEFSGRSK